MGFITTLTTSNDTIHDLPTYPDLGDEIYHAILKLSVEKPSRVGHSGLVAHESHHMDYGQAIIIGGGCRALEMGGSVYYSDKEPELTLLQQLADKHGYVLHKKRKR